MDLRMGTGKVRRLGGRSVEEGRNINELGKLGRSQDRQAWVPGTGYSCTRTRQWGRKGHGGQAHHWSNPRMTMYGLG